METFNCPITATDRAPEWATAACTLHAASITAGPFECCTVLNVDYSPICASLPSHGARSCRGKKGKEKNHPFGITSPTTHLGSCHPFPPAHTSIVQHSELLPVRRSPSSELSLTSADRQSPLATRGYGVTTRGRSDQEVCAVDHSSRSSTARRCLVPCPSCPSSAHVSDTGAGYRWRSTSVFQAWVPGTCYHLKP